MFPQELQRVHRIQLNRVDLTTLHELCNQLLQRVRLTERAADGEHDQCTDAVFERMREHPLTGGRVEQVESDHDDVEKVIVQGALQHLMPGIPAELLGYTKKAKFAQIALSLHFRNENLDAMVVLFRTDAVQMDFAVAFNGPASLRVTVPGPGATDGTFAWQVIAGVRYPDIRKRVRAALDKVGLLSKEKSWPLTLSGGEQQRVGIARATGNLDPDLSQDLFNLFLQLNRQGVTVLVASHDLALIRSMGQRVMVLSGGRLVDDISAAEIRGAGP